MNQQNVREFTQEVPPSEHGNPMTLEEFLQSGLEGYEYVEGELIPMPPTSVEHGNISSNLQWYLYSYVRVNQLGRVYTSDTGFQIGDRVLMPDVAFVPSERIPDDLSKVFPNPPDLAVEVVSPSDAFRSVVRKALDYLEVGTKMVWIVEPTSQTVRVYRSETPIRVLGINDTLTGEDVVEGFSCQVAQLFE